MEDLGEALRCDQPHAGALRLEHGVRGDGRPVQDVADVPDVDPRFLADAAHPVEDAFRGVCGSRRCLHPELPASVAIADEKEVGEGAPYVDSEPVRHRCLSPLLAGDGREGARAVDLSR